ncbi:hypothetical protein [Pseudoalteromonas sp.]|uniref:hypothetical protein n=1 Tax=Pseudoalteromonas sp. TaxID=53249 RepID=UPI0026228710|nr:hypothetical protein [Pseudoalteromonas sp.]MCP4585366.1 hypothetical protein [Pseudoalteromonas sp.]
MDIICIAKIDDNFVIFEHEIDDESVHVESIRDFGEHVFIENVINVKWPREEGGDEK